MASMETVQFETEPKVLDLRSFCRKFDINDDTYQKLSRVSMTVDLLSQLYSKNSEEFISHLTDGKGFTMNEALSILVAIGTYRHLLSNQSRDTHTKQTMISSDEQRIMDRLDSELVKLDSIAQLYQSLSAILDSSVTRQSQLLHAKMSEIIDNLQSRRLQLHSQLNEWKATKQSRIDDCSKQALLYRKQISEVRNEWKRMTNDGNVSDTQRYSRLETMSAQLKSDPNNAIYQSSNRLFESFSELTSKPIVDMPSLDISDYGSIKVEISEIRPMIECVLDPPIIINKSEKGYFVTLKWKVSQKETSDILSQLCLQLSNEIIDNSQMRIEMSKSDDDEKEHNWEATIDSNRIKQNRNDSFIIDTPIALQYNIEYRFRVSLHCRLPFAHSIVSNIQSTFENAPKPKPKPKPKPISPPISDPILMSEEIALAVESHRKHWSTYHPNKLLSKDAFYGSAKNSHFMTNNESIDWIIFKAQCNQSYRQLSQLKIRNYSYSNSAVQSMAIEVRDSDSDSDEWMPIQPNPIELQKAKGWQTIDLNNAIASNTKFQFFKVSFLTNFGENSKKACRYQMYQLQLFGVPL